MSKDNHFQKWLKDQGYDRNTCGAWLKNGELVSGKELSDKLKEYNAILTLRSKESYQERVEIQLNEWVKGNPIHNHVDGECCPDFSCCDPGLLQQEEIRRVYYAGDESQRMSLLFVFLGEFLSKTTTEKIHIVGEDKFEQN